LGLIGGLSARRSNSCLPRREEERGGRTINGGEGEGRGEERRGGEARQGEKRWQIQDTDMESNVQARAAVRSIQMRAENLTMTSPPGYKI